MQLIRMTFTVTPVSDVVLPPLSSKVVKYLVLSNQVLPFLQEMVKSGEKQKPLFISNLEVNGKRLFSTGEPVAVKGGVRMFASVSFPFTKEALNVEGGKVSTPYGEFQVSLKEITILDESPPASIEGNLKVWFRTPTLLSSKIYLPPFLQERYRRYNAGFSLIPSPGLVVASAYRQYLAVLGKTSGYENDMKTFKLTVMVNALSRVVGYNLHPVTAIIGEDEKGRLRKTRGVMGWMEFDVPGSLKRRIVKYLEVGSFLGIGRSRGIGLGEISIRLVKEREGEAKPEAERTM
ncbi:CRISPR system precrRNA processing endoribonuclease RAMP protein Cas6 [Metallosphaera javensis (ex Sakai et al. 2022)]|uniref:CRISPR system precrRNA processing endoribonuclease RAMP protein Cas6 n=1 Tax=Metallosphaera javensis (ex Sakai et al. 2022) TaxID=2775498 RepID=UPI00258FC090|nr:MAG: CRISPR-associated endoribonuclease Cas6 1 [Metallosphaera javensis (ex Sakai et al. 2022)]